MTFDGGWVMNVHKTPFACTLLILIACGLFPKAATAQYSISQCVSLAEQTKEAQKAHALKTLIHLARQHLTYCKQFMERDDYTTYLDTLALALNSDNQHGEALGVASRCLEVNAADFACIFDKADALRSLGRVSEAMSVVERSLSLPPITEFDARDKEILRNLKVQLSAV